jgi:hypothetical protein
MFCKTPIKNSSPSPLNVASLQNLIVELDAPAEELVSGGTGRIPIFILGTLNPRTGLGDVTPMEPCKNNLNTFYIGAIFTAYFK